MKLLETAIYKLESLNNDIFIKRDDLIPFSFGGNKVRKAIYFFKDIHKNKCDCIITYGSANSNHCRVISNIACKYNMPCYIVSPNSDYKSQNSYNRILCRKFNAEIINCSVDSVHDTIEQVILTQKNIGKNPYFIQGGGHGNIGTNSYVHAYQEILNYEIENNIQFDYIFHASGTGTTQAGLVCGQIINNRLNQKIIGISIARKKMHGSNVIIDSIKDYLKIHEENINDKVFFIDDYILNGYGDFNIGMLKEIDSMMKNNGVPMDTTYVGKAYYGMKKYLERENIHNKKILFIHTGGTPLFFDKINEIKNGEIQ